MQFCALGRLALGVTATLVLFVSNSVLAEGDLHKVKHIVIVMRENHSFDNYFGALAYAPGSPYHNAERDADPNDDDRGCRKNDHRCVDGLSCIKDHSGSLTCFNSNIDDGGHTVLAFHDSRRCVAPDLDHGWIGTTTRPTSTISTTVCMKLRMTDSCARTTLRSSTIMAWRTRPKTRP